MLANLRSMLSNHVAPGGALVTLSPFSCLIARVTITTARPADSEFVSDLEDALGYLDADELSRGREKLRKVVDKLKPIE